MRIYLDFDGTCVEHEYPKLGRCNFGCIEIIEKLQNAGHEIILNTYRSECKDNSLSEALKWINENNFMFVKDRARRETFELKPITATIHKLNPLPWNLIDAIAYGDMYIDDTAFGIPLKPCCMILSSMVDWDALDKQFIEHKIY